jgi:hypothetical protein
MFSPGRLLTLAIFALLVYIGFYAVPGHAPGAADFVPEVVAEHEAAAWRAAAVREEFSTMVSCILYQRELHRMSWFRAIESGMALAKGIGQFMLMTTRHDRVAPQFEQVASIERTWKGAEFDEVVVGRAHANWLAALRTSREAGLDPRAVAEMADDLGLRFGLPAGHMMAVAADRTEAYRAVLARGANPDWDHVTLLLTRSYTTLKTALTRAADARRAG